MVMMMVSPLHRAGVGPVEEGDLALVPVCSAGFVNAEQFHFPIGFNKLEPPGLQGLCVMGRGC